MMDVEGQGRLRRRDRVRLINERAKLGDIVNENSADDNEETKSTSATATMASIYYPFIIFLTVLLVLFYLITLRKGGNRKSVIHD